MGIGMFSRRSLLGGSAMMAAAAFTRQAGAAPRKRGDRLDGSRPNAAARADLLFRNAYVMTMDKAGDLPAADLHVRDGVIVAVGPNLKAPGASVIEAHGAILLPGLIETHWHMWNTLLRSMSGEKPEFGYFRTTAAIGKVFEPGDMYQGTRLAAAEALNSGITFVHDWCHNIRGAAYADADLRALAETGIRARFSYGAAQGMANSAGIDLDDLRRLHRDWTKLSNDGLISLGLAWRGMGGNNPATAIPPEIYQAELKAGRDLGLPVSVHASGSRPAIGQIGTIEKAGLLGKDMQIIHANMATREEIEALAKAGASVSMSPYTELRIGFGLPQVTEFIAAGVPIGLSVDTTELSGNADMFGIMKVLQNVENGKAENEFKLTARRVLELATIEGARSIGMADRIGSLTPGKRADVIMVSTRDVNLGVFGDPAHMLVTAAQPANVDTVLVDGRVAKRNGRLALDTDRIVREASAAQIAVRKRANWW